MIVVSGLSLQQMVTETETKDRGGCAIRDKPVVGWQKFGGPCIIVGRPNWNALSYFGKVDHVRWAPISIKYSERKNQRPVSRIGGTRTRAPNPTTWIQVNTCLHSPTRLVSLFKSFENILTRLYYQALYCFVPIVEHCWTFLRTANPVSPASNADMKSPRAVRYRPLFP